MRCALSCLFGPGASLLLAAFLSPAFGAGPDGPNTVAPQGRPVADRQARAELRAEVPSETADMLPMFNGQDLTGWDGDPRLWSVRDGAIRGESTTNNPARGNTFLIWTNGVVRDFELRVSFRCNAANNSGVQYRSQRKPTKAGDPNRWGVFGYQAEVRNEVVLPNVSGFVYDEGGKRGRMCLVGEKAVWENDKKGVLGALCTQEEYRKAFRLDDWNDYMIVARGHRFQHFINGLQVLDFTDKQPNPALREGIVAFQIHGGKPMWCEFKNPRVKHLSEDEK